MAEHANDRLDLLLGAWGTQQRLTGREAEAILAAIVQQPRESLPATWWSDLSSQVTAAVVRATTRPSTVHGDVRLGVAVTAVA